MPHILNRVQEWMDACQQILDHMEVPSSAQAQVEQMRSLLNTEREKLGAVHSAAPDTSSASLESLKSNLTELERLNEQLLAMTEQRYSEATGNAMATFESQSLNQQLHEEQAYHGKIDFKSSQKLQENLKKIQQALT
ncbi:hypothetical protein [Paenibacillus sp. J2TS4]|uniref:hypothetical protein n=1 Tax=Paenibacillus sp. J2TS4 TaxID=2807194 RepID=UPI001AFEBD2F|nr:hypothetical protein [Paenibacillus sp. J2TS4]GIP33221.1 hypothetical protein J2TS4_24310 [Paenibacillus sp. J2TS4]